MSFEKAVQSFASKPKKTKDLYLMAEDNIGELGLLVGNREEHRGWCYRNKQQLSPYHPLMLVATILNPALLQPLGCRKLRIWLSLSDIAASYAGRTDKFLVETLNYVGPLKPVDEILADIKRDNPSATGLALLVCALTVFILSVRLAEHCEKSAMMESAKVRLESNFNICLPHGDLSAGDKQICFDQGLLPTVVNSCKSGIFVRTFPSTF